ncbi:hypothetical protein D6827_00980 [Candidatus Parcubacteria bacterium]|nr:MAG: hypothetical protein D6827_00980 [Candidatus Parcubacteria bacterium]
MPNFTITIYDADNSTLINTLNSGAVYSGSAKYSLQGSDEMTIDVDHNDTTVADIQKGRVLELNHSDQSFIRRYRVNTITKRREQGKSFYRVECLGLKHDLSSKIYRRRGQIIQQTPATHIADILSGTGWSAGTITPTANITIDYDFDTVYDALKKIEDAVQNLGNYIIMFNDGLTVDLIDPFVSSASTIEYQKNLISLTHKSNEAIYTRIIGIGGLGSDGNVMTMAGAKWRVTAVGVDFIAVDSGKLLVNGAANSEWEEGIYYIAKHDDLTQKSLITGTLINANDEAQFTLDPTPFSVGDYVVLIDNNDNPVDFIYNKLAESSTVGTIIEGKYVNNNIPDIDNLAAPESLSTLTDTYDSFGLHPGLNPVFGNVSGRPNTNSSAVFSQDTANIIHGSNSQKVVISSWNKIPTIAPTLTAVAGGQLSGTYQYKITYQTPDGESDAGPVASITVNNENIQVTFTIDSGLTHAQYWNIYRTKADGTTFYLLYRVPINSGTSFIDKVSDVDLTIPYAPDTASACGGMGVSYPILMKAGKVYSFVIYTIVESGSIRVEGRNYAPSVSLSYDLLFASKGSSSLTNAKVTIIINGLSVDSDKTIDISIVANGGPATYYVDSIMAVEAPAAPDPSQFIAVQGRRQLWEEAYDFLIMNQQKTEVNFDFYDSFAVDSTNEIKVGDIISIIDNDLGINESIKIIEKQFDIRKPWQSNIQAEFLTRNSSLVLARQLNRLQKSAESGQGGITKQVPSDANVIYFEE